MPGVSIHVVDVSRGVVATGMRVELHAVDAGGKLALIAKGQIGANGLWTEPALAKMFAAGAYAAVFHVGDFYRAQGGCLARRGVPRGGPLRLRHRRPGAALSFAVQMHAVGLFVLPRRRLELFSLA